MSHREAYLRALVARHDVLLLPLDAEDRQPRSFEAPLPVIFQRLALRPAGSAPLSPTDDRPVEDFDDFLREQAYADLTTYRHPLDLDGSAGIETEVRVDELEEALSRSPGRRMVVLGGPGTGKTTLLRALTWRAARRALEDPAAPLPMFVELSDLAEHGADLRCYLPRIAASLGLPPRAGGELAAQLDEGAALVCLDGLDEVAPARRDAVLSWLSSLRASAGAWVVGSRFTQYRTGDLGRGAFAEWELLPLDEPAQTRLAERLLSRLAAADAPAPARDARRFLAALSQHPHVAAWKGVPLLLSLAAAAWARQGSLPASRSAMYKIATDALLGLRWRDPEEKRALRGALSRVALSLFRRGGRAFPRERLREAVEGLPEEARAALPGPGELTARLVGSGFIEAAGDELRFGHQTFHEYLVAVALAQDLAAGGAPAEQAWKLAWSKRTFWRWTEPLRLMVGVLLDGLGEPGAAAALRWLRALAAAATHDEHGTLDPASHPGSTSVAPGRFSLRSDTDPTSGSGDASSPVTGPLNHPLSALGDPGGLVRSLAVRSLAELGEWPASWDELEVRPIRALIEGWAARALDPGKDGQAANAAAPTLAAEVSRLPPPARAWALVPLCAALASAPERWRRAAAAEALERFGVAAPMDPLLRALGDPSPKVRQTAARALRWHAERCPSEPLVAAMRDEDPQASHEVVRTLVAMGERAPLGALLELLEEHEAHHRRAAVEALGELRERAPLQHLVRATQDEDLSVRASAVTALGRLGERAARDAAAVDAILLLVAGERASWSRRAAIDALRDLGDLVPPERWMGAVLQILDDEECLDGREASGLLIRLGPRAPFEALLTRLAGERERSADAAAQALVGLARWVPIEPLVDVLHGGTAAVQARALRVLACTGARAPVAEIAAMLSASAPRVRAAAARALGKLGERAPVDDLVLAATRDEERTVQAEALVALALIGPTAALPVLVAGLGRLDWYGLQVVVAALARAGSRLSIDALAEIARAYDEGIRGLPTITVTMYVERAVSRCTDVATLLAAMRSREERLRGLAADALAFKVIRGEADGIVETALDGVDRSGEVEALPRDAAQRLFNLCSQLAPEPWLRRELGEAQAQARAGLRLAAAQIAAAAGEPGCVPHLVALASSRDEDAQQSALDSMGVLLSRQALPEDARGALMAALLPLLDVGARKIRICAAQAAGRAGSAPPEVIEALWRVVASRASGAFSPYYGADNIAAAAALRALGAQPDVDALLNLLVLGAPDPDAEHVAAAWLASLGEAAPVEALIELLRAGVARECDGDRGRSASSAALTLGWLGARAAIGPLMEALGGASWQVREAAARALAHLAEHTPLEGMIAQLASDRSDVRRFAALSLQGRREPAAIAALTRALGDIHPDVRRCAATALGVTGRRSPALLPVKELLDAARDDRWQAGIAWESEQGRNAASEALGMRGEQAGRGSLESTLRSASTSAQFAAVEALGSLGDSMPREEIEALLGGPVPRTAALAALGRLGEEAPVAVIASFLDDSDQYVRSRAAEVLAGLPQAAAAEALIARARNIAEVARPAAAVRLLREQTEAARLAVRRWLSEGHPATRAQVARALAGAPAVPCADLADAARELAVDTSSDLRAAGLALLAAHAPSVLAELSGDAMRVLAGEVPEGLLRELERGIELGALARLPRWPAEAWERALEALGSPRSDVRAGAASTMSHQAPMPQRALAALWSRRADPSRHVRAAVDDALAEVLSREGALEDDEA
ncbi:MULTISPECIES: HEAT repeat domain-containing protein [Sorangium]|uniref:NACHT domain-containing protein n=1 Tax=Sorangium cellulosum TaxID=56 RepID=A0A4V0NF25_SORCE|nr:MULTISPECIES: HEAT repeat domain-containing protein [Sorangium]AUX28192.1 uncharacterized protein SOCE836_002600 [Sorangium cellulosum]WCQ87591.1 hypothetical protein NQZ70_00254 [Sorangium sp. Soce836]